MATAITCEVCRFDSREYTAHDAERTLASVAVRWGWMAEGIDAGIVSARPPAGGPSAAEHATLAVEAGDLHLATHHLQEAGRALHAVGAGAPRSTGTLAQINTSGGGVPKLPVPRARIGWRGLEGDHQAARKHHGRVWQAVSLWSTDVIGRLAAEGHPIGPGLAGENLTVAGVDWPTLRPGVRVQIGTALVEITAYATPCTKNSPWFLGGDFQRMNHDREPGVSRLYAFVVRAGEVRAGDPVTVEP